MLDSFKAMTMLTLEPGVKLALAAGALAMSVATRPWLAASYGVRSKPEAERPPVPMFAAPVRRSVAMQWQDLSRIVENGIKSARRAVDLQAAALVQLDAGEFALKSIGDDLRSIMPQLAARRAAPARSGTSRLELVAA